MALDLDKVGVAIKLAEERERIFKQYTSMHDEVQKAAERMRDTIDPPGLRMREMHEQLLAAGRSTSKRSARSPAPRTSSSRSRYPITPRS